MKLNIQKSLLFFLYLLKAIKYFRIGVIHSSSLGFTVASTVGSIVGSAVGSAFGLANKSIGSEVTVTQM